MTVFGWDASDYDWDRGPMDYDAAKKDGIVFASHKATEGTTRQHKHFGTAMARARDAGIPILGAYHVVRSPRNARDEVDYCLSYVDKMVPWWSDFPFWFWQIDIEKWPYDSVPAAEGEDVADIIQAQTGRVAINYASKGQYGDQLKGTSHELWNAAYGPDRVGPYREVYAGLGGDKAAGWTTYSGKQNKILQFGSKTKIGSQPTCDADAFRGSLDELKALIKGNDVSVQTDHIIAAWAQGLQTGAGKEDVEPVKWRVRDEAWQAKTDAAIAGLKTELDAIKTSLAGLTAALTAQPTVTGDVTVTLSGGGTAHIGA